MPRSSSQQQRRAGVGVEQRRGRWRRRADCSDMAGSARSRRPHSRSGERCKPGRIALRQLVLAVAAWQNRPVRTARMRAGSGSNGPADPVTGQAKTTCRAGSPRQSRRSACGPIRCCSLALLALWIALAIVFNGEPEIDRAVSSVFFAAEPCAARLDGNSPAASFRQRANAFLGALRNVLHYLPIVAAVVVVASLASELAAGRGLAYPRTPLCRHGACRACSSVPGFS